ncbi:MAG: DegT/DnrJ/EryC1/StrS family aminotransferase [Armatimonadetes bacterium]|jgi:perosamine synthetase|nr:DegT/DnrJ/EryC1/StrS family aminotransferase [Armatimonadota bacterium]
MEQRTPAGTGSMIPHSRPCLGVEETAEVTAVLASGMLAAGEQVAAFEAELSQFVGAAGGVAVQSGTAALHLALRVLEVGPGDEVILPSWVCAAVLNAVHYVGACPVVVDVDPATGNLDPAAAARARTRQTRALLVPHLNGLPADLDRLAALEVPLIEDCAQAAGATYRGQRVGSYGAVAIFSFYATKVITTGQGGMLVSTNQDLLARARDLVEYDNRDDYQVRHNYRLTDLQAAIGRQQLQRLPGFVARRRALAERFRQEGCADWHGPRDGHLYYRYLLRVRDVEAAARWFREQGIDAKRPVYRPLHHYLSGVDCPAADAIHETILSVPLYPALSAMEVDHIVGTLARWAATC